VPSPTRYRRDEKNLNLKVSEVSPPVDDIYITVGRNPGHDPRIGACTDARTAAEVYASYLLEAILAIVGCERAYQERPRYVRLVGFRRNQALEYGADPTNFSHSFVSHVGDDADRSINVIDCDFKIASTCRDRVLDARAGEIPWASSRHAIPIDSGDQVHFGDLSKYNPIAQHSGDVCLSQTERVWK